MRLDLLFAHSADLGLEVGWDDLGEKRRGQYHADQGLVVLNRRLARAQATATLAHELGHHMFGDRCSSPAVERRAWEYGASLVITADEYAEAEDLVGGHPGALATELGVTRRLILAWRRWHARQCMS